MRAKNLGIRALRPIHTAPVDAAPEQHAASTAMFGTLVAAAPVSGAAALAMAAGGRRKQRRAGAKAAGALPRGTNKRKPKHAGDADLDLGVRKDRKLPASEDGTSGPQKWKPGARLSIYHKLREMQEAAARIQSRYRGMQGRQKALKQAQKAADEAEAIAAKEEAEAIAAEAIARKEEQEAREAEAVRRPSPPLAVGF